MSRRLFTTVCSCIAGAVLCAAQGTAAPPAGQQQQPTFRTRIDSVSVDVSVTDKQGKPVTDLTAADFEIREANKPQTIDAFRLIKSDPEDIPPGLATRQITSEADQRRETEDPENRLIVIFLDDYHVRKGSSLAVRQQLARFVSLLGPRDLVAVLYPLTMIQGLTFSRNHDGTAAAMMQFEGRKYDYAPKNGYERQFDNMPPEIIEQARNELTIRALTSACVYLGSIRDGRKMVLFVSEGMSATLPVGARTTGSNRPATGSDPNTSQAFFAQTDLMSRLRDVFTAASRNNTSVSTLDPRGLAASEFSAADNVTLDNDRQVLNAQQDTLHVIADQTDGRPILNRNNPLPELQKMVSEMSAYALLGYTSTIAARDGKFHPIQVRVKRPGVEVHAQRVLGLYRGRGIRLATAPPKAGPPADIANAMEELAGIVEPSSRRGAMLWIGAARGGADQKTRITVAWEGNPAPATDSIDKVARISVVATAGSGEVVFRGPIAPDASTARLSGKTAFDTPAGLLRLKVTTENARGQRIENEDVSFEVPDYTSPHPAISTPLFFRARTVREMTTIRASEAAIPSATRQFSRTERLLLRFDAYGPAGTTPKVAVRLLNRAGDSIAPLPDPASTTGATFESELPLASLPPADYLIEITATAAGETTKKLIGIRVTG